VSLILYQFQAYYKIAEHPLLKSRLNIAFFDLYAQALMHNTKGIEYVEKYFQTRFEMIKETARKMSRDMHLEVDINNYLPNRYFALEARDIIPAEYLDQTIREDSWESALFGLGNIMLINRISDPRVRV